MDPKNFRALRARGLLFFLSRYPTFSPGFLFLFSISRFFRAGYTLGGFKDLSQILGRSIFFFAKKNGY